MISTIDIQIHSENPNIPLRVFKAFVNSPSSVRVRNVPAKIGAWKIDRVFVSVTYPDNQIHSKECVAADGLWVATVPASTLAGMSANGYVVTADGTDENGEAVTGYILGKGDVEIMDADGTITPGETTFYVHLLAAEPATPNKGDAFVDAGLWKIYNGEEWVVLGGVSAAGQYVQAPTEHGGDGRWHKVIIVDGTLAIDSVGVDEPPEAASRSWVSQLVGDEAAARAAADNSEATAREAADTTLDGKIATEKTARETADANETAAREAADTTLGDAITAEAASRAAADTAEAAAREAADDELADDLADETASREAADTTLDGQIANEAAARAAADAALQNNITTEAADRAAAVAAEAAARAAANDRLAGVVTAEQEAREDADETEAAARAAADAAEAAAREAADTEISEAVENEQAIRESADTTLRNDLNAERTARVAADTAHAEAIAALENKVAGSEESGLKTLVTAEAAARAAADTNFAGQIADEAAARAAADALAVHLNGEETIGGVKTFSQTPNVPTVQNTDDNSTKAASTGWVAAKLTAWWNAIRAAAVTFTGHITASGGITGTLTGHATEDAKDSEVVHVAGDETIEGTKIFADNFVKLAQSKYSWLHMRHPGLTRGQIPSAEEGAVFVLEDVNGNNIAYLLISLTNTGRRDISLRAFKDNGEYVNLARFSADADGNASVYGSAMAAVSMPSRTGIALALPESGSLVVFGNGVTAAPRSGWLICQIRSTAEGQYIRFVVRSSSQICYLARRIARSANGTEEITVPVPLGASVTVEYTMGGTVDVFRFAYNNGDN